MCCRESDTSTRAMVSLEYNKMLFCAKPYLLTFDMSNDYNWVDANPNSALEIPQWGCQNTFKEGREFLDMTYAELYAKLQELHVLNGGIHLDVHSKPFGSGRKAEKSAIPGRIKFYCPHSRDNGEQAGKKDKKNPSAPRADRSSDERRVFFNSSCPCNFHFLVRRKAECPVPALQEGGKGHKEYMKCQTKCDWFIDGEKKQKDEGRKRNAPVLHHNGHPRNTLPIAKVTPPILEFIETLAKHQVTVASIASAILEKFHCVIPDSALYYAIRGLGYAIDSLGNQVLVKKTFKSHTDALLHSLQSCRDVAYALLLENFEKSSASDVVYETWVRGFDDEKEHLLPSPMTFEGGDLLKPKKMQKGAETVEMHGRTYDTSRICEINGERKFFIGVIWTQLDELRMFEAFPEVLVMDAKAKTNKHKHAYFAGVGVDSFWLNNTLFRAWVPNQTDETYTWMTNVGLPAIVPIQVLKLVRSIFTDDDSVVNVGIELLQQCGELFEYAKAYLCGYHIVRNFHSEFGIGCKQKFGLRGSSTKYRKGGVIEWGHPWQQHCADAIYRLQQCETVEEANECFEWVTNYVKTTKDIARKSLRKQVLKFFIRKFKKKEQWVLAYRLFQRTLDLKSTSRVEGEFSGVHTMKLSSKLGMQKGFHKLRFYADRRRIKKTRLCQAAISKVSKKKSTVMSQEEYKFLDNILTPYYCNKVEIQVERAIGLETQLVSASPIQAVFRVWCLHDDDNAKNEDEGSECSDSSVDDAFSNSSEASESESETKQEGRRTPLGITVDSDDDSISTCASEGLDDFKPFKWRRVRTVVCDLEDDSNFHVKCNCGYFLRTCIICRHILRVLKEVLKNWGFSLQPWHMRLLKKFYYEVITTLKAVGGADQVPQAIIPKAALFAFCASTFPSNEGVPFSGRFFLDADNVDVVQNGDDGEAFHDKDFSTDITDATRKKKRRGKNQEDCREKFTTIMFDLKGDATGTSEFYNLMYKFQKQRGRASVSSKPGAPDFIRTRSVADKKKGASKPKPKKLKERARKEGTSHVMNKHYKNSDKDQAALRHLEKYGSVKGHILETYNDENDDRWFMVVEDGSTVTDGTGDIQIKKCWWLMHDSLTERDPAFPHAIGCDIDQVKACGPPNSFTVREKKQVKQVKHAAAGPKTANFTAPAVSSKRTAPVTPATHFGGSAAVSSKRTAPVTPATHFGGSAAVGSKRTADRVEISSDSDDSDAPISKAAIKMAKESAAAAKAAAAQKPEQPKVTTKQVVAYVQSLQAQRTPASGDSDPPIKRKKGMTCINGEWHISE